MSKPLCTLDPHQKARAITRRLNQGTRGLGFWAAFDAIKHQQEEARTLFMERYNAYLAKIAQEQSRAGLSTNDL